MKTIIDLQTGRVYKAKVTQGEDPGLVFINGKVYFIQKTDNDGRACIRCINTHTGTRVYKKYICNN